MAGGRVFGWLRRTCSFVSERSSAAARDRLLPESRFTVTVDDRGVVCRRPSGQEETVAWDDLDAVIIETNDTGPWGIDVWWLLFGRDGSSGCAIPQGATGEKQLLEAVQRLPGFDNAQLIAAMSCTDNRKFLCWRRAGWLKG
jgi:hypothetical protein